MAKKGQFKRGAKADSVKQREYNSKPEQKKNRAARNQARREAQREGSVRKGDGKDVDHKQPLSKGGSTSKSNTRVRDSKSNRLHGASLGGRAKARKY